ncbi:MAG: c-type cytochrome [Geminicoccales bacterium]
MAAFAAVAGIALRASETIDAALTGEAAIKARKEAMKANSKDNKVIQAFVKDGKGSAADVVKAATDIAESSKKIPSLFPKGTGRGDFPDKTTRALPAIWKDWSGFEKAADTVVAEAEKLAAVAKEGDKDAIAKQAAALSKNGCGGCHKTYRGEKVK